MKTCLIVNIYLLCIYPCLASILKSRVVYTRSVQMASGIGVALSVVLLLAFPLSAAGNGCTATQITNDLLPNHASPSNCWTVIVVNRQKVVYDVTRLVSNHEGGRRVIEQMCGRDGTIGFWWGPEFVDLRMCQMQGIFYTQDGPCTKSITS